ncbi:DUF6461 domain-containing protein [Sphaerisporangium siamense]|uniref:DUF6461 domain-containing protein n=1 Tax=Sphaerisporangium siamense TaxID=795645 RepID=UPI0035A23A28
MGRPRRGRRRKWCVAVELWGWQATLAETLHRLSEGSEVVAVGRHDYAEDGFEYAVEGNVVTGFTPQSPGSRWGREPDRLNELMRRVGLSPEEPDDEQWDGCSARAPRWRLGARYRPGAARPPRRARWGV